MTLKFKWMAFTVQNAHEMIDKNENVISSGNRKMLRKCGIDKSLSLFVKGITYNISDYLIKLFHHNIRKVHFLHLIVRF